MIEGLLEVHDYLRGPVDLTLREIGPAVPADPHRIAGFDIAAMETRHSMACLAYRISEPDNSGTPTFSGDTEAFAGLADFADGSAVLVHDCSFPDGIEASNHPSPQTLKEALGAADPEVGRVFLTHLYPHTEGAHEGMLTSLRKHYHGDVEFARDGLTVEVS